MSFDVTQAEEQARMMEILLVSVIVQNGGRVEITQESKNLVMEKGLHFDFNPDPITGNGVLTILDETKANEMAESFMRTLLQGAGFSDKEIDDIIAETRDV